ncbi:MAG TPA: stage II sporulation protein M, partial [Pirellulales bacterium]|nr:stage II sporulation protein M [Pirellulales bacterium]
YRAACADLALADAYQLPPATVDYLHQLVGRAHNQMYRGRGFNFAAWLPEMLRALPRRLLHDNSLRLAFIIFWGMFIAAACMSYYSPVVADRLLGQDMINAMERMYDKPLEHSDANESSAMAGYYTYHNPAIGLQCFACGLLLGIGGLFITISNAAIIGAVFGHMATVPQSTHFFHFVTAHCPFELTAVVLAAGAGMRLGFSLVDTGGWRRGAALRRAAREAVPSICASIVLFLLAALIEGYVSRSPLPYWSKAALAIVSTLMMLFFIFGLGYSRRTKLAIG